MSQEKENLFPEVVAGAFILNNQNKVALFKSTRWNDIWLPPGGHVDYGETLEQAVKREVKEEVGLNVDNVELIRFSEIIEDPGFYRKAHLIFFHFSCRAKSPNIKIDNNEIIDYKWFTIDEILKSKEVDERTRESIRELKKKIKNLNAKSKF